MGLFSRLFKKRSKKVKKLETDDVIESYAEKEFPETASVKNVNVVIEPTHDRKSYSNMTKNTRKSQEPKKQLSAGKVEHLESDFSKTTQKTTVMQNSEESKEEILEVVASVDEKKTFTGKFEINRSKDGKKFFFNLFASNQVGIATSQMYSSAQSALTGVKSVIVNAPKAPIEDQTLKKFETLPNPKWEIYLDNGNKYRFRLNATNGICVCHSQGYTTKTACKNGIDSIIRSSKNAQIIKTYLTKD